MRVAVSVSAPGGVRADLEEIFRRDYQRVVGVAARVLGSRDQAEDVAQEVFLSFGRSSVPAGEARGWLCVAAAHTALNLLRSGAAAPRGSPRPSTDDGVVSDVAETVVTLEERRRVRAALGRLPHKQAVALVLRHSGMSYADVAAALDMSPGSVGTTVRRAESALREELTVMRHPTEGVLRRLLDEPAAVADSDRRHVAGCLHCLDALAAVRADAVLVGSALATGAAQAADGVDVTAAWRRLSTAAPAPEPARPGRPARQVQPDAALLRVPAPPGGRGPRRRVSS
jgi:RNA polymerase sigma-70 factor (ECF subfamily)